MASQKHYLQRVVGTIESGELEEDEEGKALFVSNVLEEIKDSEYRLACDMHCSGAIEKLVRFAGYEQLATLFARLGPNISDLLVSRCGSHVLQAIVERLPALFAHDEPVFGGKDAPPPLSKQFFDLCEKIADNFEELVVDTYASHVLRACLCVLAGKPMETNLRSKSSQSYRQAFVNAEGDAGAKKVAIVKPILTAAFPIVGKIAAAALGMVTTLATCLPQASLSDVLVHRVGSPVIQTLLSALFAVRPLFFMSR